MSQRTDEPTLTARYSHALTLSYVWHRTQTRKSRDTPYLAHLMSVSALVLESGGDEELGIAGLLHDALEDAGSQADAEARREVIRQEFGERVLRAVEGCTDGTPAERREMSWGGRKTAYVAHVRDDAHPDAVAVSLCDKLHNARSILRDLKAAGRAPDADRAAQARQALWARFTGRKMGSLWYYAALEHAYRSRRVDLPDGFADPLDELGRTVEAMLAESGVARAELEAPKG